jgi:SAM-dependent methyltransferase
MRTLAGTVPDFYSDDGLVLAVMAELRKRGISLLQLYLLAPTEAEHIAELLRLMEPKRKAVILDAGCGTGALAAGMKALRPDLELILLNLCQPQLDLCPEGMRRVHGDFHLAPLPDSCVDIVMHCYTLGHADFAMALADARRLLRPGGEVFIYELGASVDRKLMEAEYEARSPGTLRRVAEDLGFAVRLLDLPQSFFSTESREDAPGAKQLMRDTRPMVCRLAKRD